jgi:hypothetical protein
MLLGLVAAGSSPALVLNVPSSYATIQAGIDAATGGDTVLVAPGTYYENINFRGRNIVVGSTYLYTASPGAIDSTIINGGNPITDTASCVLIVSGEDSTAVLEGFTLTRGAGTPWTDEHGAGQFREGGGILVTLSSPVIRHNVIVDNSATSRSGGMVSAGGGGIRVGDGNPLIEGNVIMSNNGRYGAGIVLNYTGARIRNNIIFNNRGGQDYGGGGIWVYEEFSAPKVIENNTIVNNSSTTNGGGMRVWDADSVVFRNNIVWGDTAATGQELFDPNSGARVSYCDVQGGWTGNGNIEDNPLFALHNFYLTPGSPCVDAGNPGPAYNDPDSSGAAKWPALGGLRNDIGAYGGPGASVLATTFYGISERTSVGARRFGLTVQPQPCRTTVAARFAIPREGQVSLTLYDAAGRQARPGFAGRANAGSNTVPLNVTGLAAGSYVCRLESGGCVETVPIVVAK